MTRVSPQGSAQSAKSKRVIIPLVAILIAVALATYLGTRSHLAPGQPPLADVDSLETLRTQFNRDNGQARLILLISPT